MIWYDIRNPEAFNNIIAEASSEKRVQNGTGVIWFLAGAATVILAMVVYDRYFRIPPTEQEH